ncbi:MAG: hypothetical protein CMP81_11325 [Fulvimarina sp.]|nr:hypothetical protein [Fulvimarina sp.]
MFAAFQQLADKLTCQLVDHAVAISFRQMMGHQLNDPVEGFRRPVAHREDFRHDVAKIGDDRTTLLAGHDVCW